MRWHWQNLNEIGWGKGEDAYGSPIKHGRAWFSSSDDKHNLRVEWSLGARLAVYLAFNDDEDTINGSLSVGPSFYWGVTSPIAKKLLSILKIKSNQEFSLRVHDGHIWWKLGADPMSWDRTVPKWKDGNIDVIKCLFGKEVVSKRRLATETVTIPMPEADYPAEIELEELSYSRSRLPMWLCKKYVRADVNLLKNAVPHAGKGENSWDCGDDATYRASFPAKSINDAILKFINMNLNTRMKNGGRSDLRWTREAPKVNNG